ncbi:restriction endonuclease subunit S [Hafnia paralvei]|uniref:restriction endonuclease subunit S n=1 Tax=Hafnia paralvei TaxID=546367 RepID=UPI001034FC48|nr:restriction endonuclease subunit S [Hafnia paralvei]TBM07324.1 restriction endonuclease subunit S [Hafnia paralvei]
MAKYKAYPEYKDSGVEWLGEIPRHWTLSKFRYNFAFSKGLTITKENLRDEGIPCVNYGEVHSKYGFEVDPRVHTLKCVDEKYLKDNASSLLLNGDIVFADTSEDLEGSGNFTQLISDTRTFAGYHTIISRPFRRGNARFYAYLLDCQQLRTQVRTAVKGVKVFSVTQAILRNLSIWLPSEKEQQRIAAFLDHETAKIDNLIEKQQQLIELLKEKRQAVISHAVTKGLNPDVPMKDSGVEWLGKVPKHWVSSSLKHKANIIDCKHITAEFSDTGIPVASIGEVKNWFVDLSTAKLTNERYYRSLIEGGRKPLAGDIIYSRNATVGEAAIVGSNMPPFAMGQDVCLIKTKENIIPEYILYVLKSNTIFQQLNLAMIGSTFKRINVDDIRNFSIAIPPKNEQISIVNVLKAKLEKYDQTVENAELLVNYMQERRTALISAAVTGKIDVRDWVAPNACEVEVSQEATA